MNKLISWVDINKCLLHPQGRKRRHNNQEYNRRKLKRITNLVCAFANYLFLVIYVRLTLSFFDFFLQIKGTIHPFHILTVMDSIPVCVFEFVSYDVSVSCFVFIPSLQVTKLSHQQPSPSCIFMYLDKGTVKCSGKPLSGISKYFYYHCTSLYILNILLPASIHISPCSCQSQDQTT